MMFGDGMTKLQQAFNWKVIFLERIALQFIYNGFGYGKRRLPESHFVDSQSLFPELV